MKFILLTFTEELTDVSRVEHIIKTTFRELLIKTSQK